MKDKLELLKFFQKVKVGKDSECWPWTGYTKKGYGSLRIFGKSRLAHIVSFEYFHGPLDEGFIVRHKCDFPACCNPFHLVSGTHADNVADRVERDRSAKGMNNGRAKLDDDKVRSIFFDTRKSHIIAKEYDVDASVIRQIWAKLSWRHVTDLLIRE